MYSLAYKRCSRRGYWFVDCSTSGKAVKEVADACHCDVLRVGSHPRVMREVKSRSTYGNC
jgi:hypothetical protein